MVGLEFISPDLKTVVKVSLSPPSREDLRLDDILGARERRGDRRRLALVLGHAELLDQNLRPKRNRIRYKKVHSPIDVSRSPRGPAGVPWPGTPRG